MSLAANDPRPPKKQLAETLRRKIESGDFPDGRIPPTRALASTYNLATQTVRNGLQILVNEGVIFAAGNRGYFVTSQVPEGAGPGTSDRGATDEIKEIHSEIKALAARVQALEARVEADGAGGA